MKAESEANPYAPPIADITVADAGVHRAWGWKLYFWLFLFGYFAGGAAMALFPEALSVTAIDYVGLVFYIWVSVGLFGFCFCRCIANRLTWQICFPLNAVLDVTAAVASDFWGVSESEGVGEFVFGIVSTVLFMVPQYIAMYRYAFREERLWVSQQRDGR